VKPHLDFWFDFASNYSYLSAMRIDDLAAAHGIAVSWKPFLLGPIFADSGWDTSPFNVYPNKGRYVWRDMERITRQRGLAFTRPDVFPQFALTATRIAVACHDAGWLPAFCRALFTAEFGEGKDISSDDMTRAALAEAGANPATIMPLAADADVKLALRNRVEQARSLGIFGAPTFITPDGELFWGDDRLDQAVAWVAENGHKNA
jgi:2-hydroxychromene-2-carboxylate isomerase